MELVKAIVENAPPTLEDTKDCKFSKPFKLFVHNCLTKDPLKRPSASSLLKVCSFFLSLKILKYTKYNSNVLYTIGLLGLALLSALG